MTPEQAVQILFNAARRSLMSADQHVQAQEAAQALTAFIKAAKEKSKPEGKTDG